MQPDNPAEIAISGGFAELQEAISGAPPADLGFLSGGGAMGALIRAFDWQTTPLGPARSWPQSLRSAVRLILSTNHPMLLFWGPAHICLYNDAYRASLGPELHPSALGGQASEVWAQIWDVVGPQIDLVMSGRGSTWHENQLVPIPRHGRLEDVYWTYSYSPFADETAENGVGGALVICAETTAEMISARRRDFLLELEERFRALTDPLEVADLAARMLKAQLDVGEVGYAVIDPKSESTLRDVWRARNAARASTGRGLDDYGAALGEELRAGRVLQIDDTATDPRVLTREIDGESLPRALLVAPVMRSGKLAGLIYASLDRPRQWTKSEVEFVEVVAARVWSAVERTRAVAACAESEARLQALTDSIDPMVWSIGPDGCLDYLNLRWYEYTGMVQGSLAGALVGNLIHPADRAQTAEDLRSALETGRRHHSEHRLLHHTGVYRWVLSRAQPIRDPEGRITRWYGTTTDIQEIVEAREVLARSRAELERLVAERTADRDRIWTLSTDIMLVARFDGTIVAVNPAWQSVLGWSEAELVGGNVLDFIYAEDAETTLAVAEAVIAGSTLRRFDNRYRHKEGGFRWLAWTVVPGDGLINAVGRDVTAELERARALQIAESRIRAVFETTDQYQAFADPDGILLDANPAALEGIGARYEDVVGKPFWEAPWFARTPGMPEEMKAGFEAASQGQIVRREVTLNLPGGPRSFDYSMRPARDPSGRIIGIVPEAIDTTDRRRVEEALRQSQKMEAIGQLTGGIAHDFNNMLAIVIGSLELLQRRLISDDTRLQRHLGAAADAAQRAALLTQRLLAFSRQQPLRPELLDVNKLVQNMSELLGHSLGGAVVLETVLAAGLWPARADPNQLENVILNLAVNARDAMPEGGRLTIETQNTHVDARYASANLGVSAGQYVMIAVTDTGKGMSPEVVAKAFEPFFTTKPVGQGTGLGLSQVYGFVKQSGGHVKIYSEPDHGTTVKLYLPRYLGTAEPLEPEPAAPGAVAEDSDDIVLVVEDDQSMRQFSAEALRELGYAVLEADGAVAALAQLEAHPNVALMFTDVVMPEINGRKLADEARRRYPALKILFTTGYTRNAVVHNGVLDPDVDLIGKPFSIVELAAKIRTMLQSAG